jgi:uncharacterized repeat protein (TIGR03803 family)
MKGSHNWQPARFTTRLAAGLLLASIANVSTPRANSQTLELLHSFFIGVDGVRPNAALVQAADGKFYGTTYGYANQSDGGTVFTITPDGTFNTLCTFRYHSTNGYCPSAALVRWQFLWHSPVWRLLLGNCFPPGGSSFECKAEREHGGHFLGNEQCRLHPPIFAGFEPCRPLVGLHESSSPKRFTIRGDQLNVWLRQVLPAKEIGGRRMRMPPATLRLP